MTDQIEANSKPKNEQNSDAKPTIEPLAVRRSDVGPLLGYGQTKIGEMIRDGTLESIKNGRSRLITMRSIKRLLYSEAA